ncbi:MAG TPA: diguanylate cyclase [Anaerolineales bacterium]|nr:diguanylate cyclase [Anaerolineales bacterium]
MDIYEDGIRVESLTTDRSPIQNFPRLKWLIAAIGVIVITVVEAFHLRQGGTLIQHFADWLIQLAAVAVLIMVAFIESDKLRSQLHKKLTETHSQGNRQAALIQLSMKLATTLDEDQICQIVVDELHNTMGYQNLELFVLGKNRTHGMMYSPASGQIIIENGPPLIDLTTSDLVVGPPQGITQSAVTSSGTTPESTRIRIPLKLGNETLGGLLIKGQHARMLTEGDYSVLTSAANQASLAIANARLFDEQRRHRLEAEDQAAKLRDRERSLRMIGEITQTALESQDFLSMLQDLTDNLGNLYEADGAFIALWDETTQVSHIAACYGSLRQVARNLFVKHEDLALTHMVLQSGKPEVIADASNSPHISSRLAAQLQIRSLMAIPLTADGQKMGTAILTFQKGHTFKPQEISFGEQTGKQIALAIAKVHALDSANQRAQELSALQRATAALLSTLELEALLGQILDASISAISAAERGSLHLVAQDTGQLQIRATQGYTDPRIRTMNQASYMNHIARAVQERKPLIVQDTQADGQPKQAEIPELRAAVSTIVAPLLLGEATLGAISLDSFHRYAFGQADLDLLVSFAATATTAIQNAQLHAEVQKQAITDTLTGLYNRRGLFELGKREVERAHRFDRPLAAMMLDIDLFKNINDEHGHLTGDRVLANMSGRCAQELRQIDILGRYGGDEFVALLPETDRESARLVAERMRSIVQKAIFAYGTSPVKVTLSIGIATLSEGCNDLESLIEYADQALYAAKQSGRNRVMVYQQSLKEGGLIDSDDDGLPDAFDSKAPRPGLEPGT